MIIRFVFFGLCLMHIVNITPVLAENKSKNAVNVIVSPVTKSTFSDRVEALGTSKANETVLITTDIVEKISSIHFEDGQQVKKDALLVVLDKNEQEADLKAAQAALLEAQQSYTRARNLQDSNALSKATVQQRYSELERNKALVESIKSRIESFVITAPFDGVLGLREVSVGALVQPGDTITTIDDLSVIKVDFDVPSVFLSTLEPGLKIIGKVEAFQDRVFEGRVQTVNTQIDPVTRTVKVRAILPNEDRALKPGLLMSIVLLKNTRDTLLIPEESLIKRADKNFVFLAVEENNKTVAREREIKIGAREPGVIEVLSGLDISDRIVSHGMLKISDGVEIVVKSTGS
tara:strand:- start:12330 stop:13370 length:1041 start_codon:yes stop_codon:yes gene_type:complete